MYCSQCGKEIPDNSKFCQECGFCVVDNEKTEFSENINNSAEFDSKQDNTDSFSTNYHNENIQITNKDQESEAVPKPKLIQCIGLGVATVLSLFSLVLTTQISFIAVVVTAFLFIGCLGGWISAIKDYSLSRKDFAKYEEKVLEERKIAKAKQEEKKAQKEVERKQQIELNRSRAKIVPTCPKCGSKSIATINRGYSMVTGFIGSGKPVNVCQVCGYRWKPGK